jgi:hypothetical protein
MHILYILLLSTIHLALKTCGFSNVRSGIAASRRPPSPVSRFSSSLIVCPFTIRPTEEKDSTQLQSSTNNTISNAEFDLDGSSPEALRRRAQQLRNEADALEQALRKSRTTTDKSQASVSQSLFDRLFSHSRPLTPEAVASVLRSERWSVDRPGLGISLRQAKAIIIIIR